MQRDNPDAPESECAEMEESDSECEDDDTGSISSAIGSISAEDEITKTEPSFLALALFLDPSKRITVPLSALAQGCFPTEIYRLIVENIEDIGTHLACMAAYLRFREMYHKNSSIIEGLDVLPNEATMAYTHAGKVWNDETPPNSRPEHVRRSMMRRNTEPSLMPGIRVVEPPTGSARDVTIDRVIRMYQHAVKRNIWHVLVGKIRHRRSLLLDMKLAFREVEKHLQE